MPHIHTALVLDKSGSMHSVRQATVHTYNEQVEQLQIDARENPDIISTASLITFNSNVYEHLWEVPAHALQLASLEGYDPAGGTNIWDAMGYVIDRWESELVESDYYRMTVISDGQHEEPRPKRTAKMLHKQVTRLQDNGFWTFAFMGCSKRYLEQFAKETGVHISNTATWSAANNAAAVNTAAKGLLGATQKYMGNVRSRQRVSANYFNDADELRDLVAEAAADMVANPPAKNIAPAALDMSTLLDTVRSCQPTVSDPLAGAARSFAFASSCCSSNPKLEMIEPINVNLKFGTANVFGTCNKVS